MYELFTAFFSNIIKISLEHLKKKAFTVTFVTIKNTILKKLKYALQKTVINILKSI